MRRIASLALLACFLVLAALALPMPAAAESDFYRLTFQKVVDGVYVASRPDPLRSYVEGNVTIIVNEHDVVVVDAGSAPPAARNVIAEIRRLTKNPVRYVVFTHIHRDHRFGAQEYLKAFPGVEIVAHPIVRDVVANRGATFVADTAKRLREKDRAETLAEIERLRAEGKPGNQAVIANLQRYVDEDLPVMLDEYPRIVNVAPTATFEGKMTLHRGARTIELLFLGRGDTDHDVVVYLPNDKVVCAGDMVVHTFPYGFSQQPVEWLATLRQLAALDFEHLVPGHGDVQHGKTYLQSVIALVASVQEQVAAGIAEGLDLAGVEARVDLSRFERQMAGDDPVKRYFFRDYFAEPAIREAFAALKPQS